MSDSRSVAVLQAEGYTHLETICAGCGYIVLMPWGLMRGLRPEMTVAEIEPRLKCQRCGSPPRKVAPWRQHDHTPPGPWEK